jgi:hypothetical protein
METKKIENENGETVGVDSADEISHHVYMLS